jgi:DNA-binding NarL/FixJ family response regulator
MADAIVLIDDLFFQAKLFETAKLTQVALEAASTGEQLLRLAAANPHALVIVDLNARQGALQAIEQLCSESKKGSAVGGGCGLSLEPGAKSDASGNPRRVIAFLSHVQTDLAERARAAGCQEVMPRSKFTQNLATILRGAKT